MGTLGTLYLMSRGEGVRGMLLIVLYMNSTIPTYSPDGATLDAAITKLLYPLVNFCAICHRDVD